MNSFLRVLPVFSLVSVPLLVACTSVQVAGTGTGGSTSAGTASGGMGAGGAPGTGTATGAGGCLQPGDDPPTAAEQACVQAFDCTTPAPHCWFETAPDCNDGPLMMLRSFMQPSCEAGKCVWVAVDTDCSGTGACADAGC